MSGLKCQAIQKHLNDMISMLCFMEVKLLCLEFCLPMLVLIGKKLFLTVLHLKGIYGREMFETWYKMTVMIQSGLDITPVITHRYPVDQYQEAFELMKSGNSGKVILNWE
jgi:threonine 3-dehydrogenase